MMIICQVRAKIVLNTEEQIADYVTISGVDNDITLMKYSNRQSRQTSSLNNNGHTAVSTL